MAKIIKGVFIDLDNTVLDFTLSEKVSVKKALESVGLSVTDEIVKLYSEINDSQWKLLEKGLTTREKLIVERFKILFDTLGVDINPQKAQDAYGVLLAQSAYLIDGAVDAVKELKQAGYKVFIASNGTKEVQNGRIAKSGIAPFFDGIFISQELGAYKPAKEFFDKALDIAKLKPNEVVMVGDSISSDILGGINAGLYTVLYSPNGTDLKGTNPDKIISNIRNLPSAVSEIETDAEKTIGGTK